MKRKVVSKKKVKQRKPLVLFFTLFLVAALGLTLYAIGQQWLLQSKAQSGKVIILQPNPEIPRPNLQLQTFPFITIPAPPPQTPKTPDAPDITPPAGGYCPLDDVKPADGSCKCLDMNAVACPAPDQSSAFPSCPKESMPFRLPPGTGKWFCVTLGSPGLTSPNPPPPPPGCSNACIAKPVIYLYPTKRTKVDVSVSTPGEIFVSDPLYPPNGWKDVQADPDGTLMYQGKKYKELFYESTVVKKIEMPEKGIWIKDSEIEPELRRITTQLGLIDDEQKEFLEFWVPVLKNLHAPYIYFSILPQDVKDVVDKVYIVPEPDTRIEFIAYFKPFNKPFDVEPLPLPETPPARIGFTEVEWGGTIGE